MICQQYFVFFKVIFSLFFGFFYRWCENSGTKPPMRGKGCFFVRCLGNFLLILRDVCGF